MFNRDFSARFRFKIKWIHLMILGLLSGLLTAASDPWTEVPNLTKRLIPSEGYPEPRPVSSEQYYPVSGIYKWELPNGAVFFYRQTKLRDQFLLQGSRSIGGKPLWHSGLFQSDQDYLNGEALWGGLNDSGIGDLSPEEKTELLEGRESPMVSLVGLNFMQYYGLNRDAELVMQMIHARFSTHRLNRSAFEQMKQERIKRTQSLKTLSGNELRFSLQIEEKLYPQNHRKSIDFLRRSGELLDFERMQSLYSQFYNSPNQFIFFSAGPLPPDQMKKLAEKYLSILEKKPASRPESLSETSTRPLTERARFDFPTDGDNAGQLYMTWNTEGREIIDRASLRILEKLVSILIDEASLEPLESASPYSPSLPPSTPPLPFFKIYQTHDLIPLVRASLSAKTESARLEEILSALNGIILRIQQRRFDPEQLQQARESLLKKFESSTQTSFFWIEEMQEAFYRNQSLKGVNPKQEWIQKLRSVSSETVADLARKFLDPKHLIIFTKKKTQ